MKKGNGVFHEAMSATHQGRVGAGQYHITSFRGVKITLGRLLAVNSRQSQVTRSSKVNVKTIMTLEISGARRGLNAATNQFHSQHQGLQETTATAIQRNEGYLSNLQHRKACFNEMGVQEKEYAGEYQQDGGGIRIVAKRGRPQWGVIVHQKIRPKRNRE
ncbi:hypothetical protein ARMSODRAFT_975558 [Armillaria solidipes]|uniref:Uncharacterized protein n=1 Tax=Armillaria solidipes TaxID=1076256 RepID=A0A2H3BRJ5_9AGAR|nr:hypothetical protein ARMSODRAFT_975558 [Armillaria solidipes]